MKKVKLGDLWEESKIVSENPNSDKRIKVRLNVKGIEKRPEKNDQKGATKYFKRKAGQFIYGKQNLHKGAFGIIPGELDEHESSSDIPSFDIIEECNPEWIYYYFKQGNFYKELEQYSKGTGSKRIHPDKIAHLEIPLPNRKEQNKIIEKIKLQEDIHSKLDNAIDYQKTLLTKLKQAILQEAFSKENSNLVQLGDFINFEPGKKIERKKYSYLEARYLRGKKEPRILDKGNFVVQGELIILMDGENSGEVFELNESGYLGSTFKILRYSKEVNRKYLQYFLMLNKDRYKNSKKGIAIPHLDKKLVRETLFPLPPLVEQRRIVEKVDALMVFCDELELRIKENKEGSERLMGAVLGEVFGNGKH